MNPMYSGHYTFEQPTNQNCSLSLQRVGLQLTFADCKGGFPHSEISGSKGARASPDLIAACHVLHRLSTPRHPSEALMRLIVLSKTHAWGRFVGWPYEEPDDIPHMRFNMSLQTLMSSRVRPGSAEERRTDPSIHDVMDPGRLAETARLVRKTDVFPRSRGKCFSGGARRDRTDDLMLAKHALYQLSYGPHSRRKGRLIGSPYAGVSRRSHCCPPEVSHEVWWAQADSNCRPHAYQACALTN